MPTTRTPLEYTALSMAVRSVKGEREGGRAEIEGEPGARGYHMRSVPRRSGTAQGVFLGTATQHGV